MNYWIIEATPQGAEQDKESTVVWDKNAPDPARAVREARRLAQDVLRPRGTLVHWAVYGPFKCDQNRLWEDGVI